MSNNLGATAAIDWEDCKKSPWNLARSLGIIWTNGNIPAWEFWNGLSLKERELVHSQRELLEDIRTWKKLKDAGIEYPAPTVLRITAWPFRKPENKRSIEIEDLAATIRRRRKL